MVFTNDTVIYTPLPAFVGLDEFAYFIIDKRGGFGEAKVSVTVNSTNSTPANVVFGPTINGTNFLVRFGGTPGTAYTIEKTDNLMPPIAWQKVMNVTAPSDNSSGFGVGAFEFNADAGAADKRFYRTVAPAY